MQTVKRQWHQPNLLVFSELPKQKAEGLEKLQSPNSKGMSEEPEKQEKVTKKFASNAKVSDKTKVKPKFPPCSVCQQILWNCVVLKKTLINERSL